MVKNKNNNTTPQRVMMIRSKMSKDITTYNHISIVRSVMGVVCIGLGITTTIIPFTTIPLIMLGSWLLGYDGRVIVRRIGFYFKSMMGWVYAHRNLTLIKATFKRRLLRWNF